MPRAFANYTLHDRSKSQIVVCQWEAFFQQDYLPILMSFVFFPGRPLQLQTG